jgi:hypothetical protein
MPHSCFRSLLIVGMLLIGSAVSIYAQATTEITKEKIPFTTQLVVCGSNTILDQATLTGTLLVKTKLTIDDTGRHHFVSSTTFQNVSGETPSGIKLRLVGTESRDVNNIDFEGPPENFTSQINLRLIAEGSENNLMTHVLLHTTVNANGEAPSLVMLSLLSHNTCSTNDASGTHHSV